MDGKWPPIGWLWDGYARNRAWYAGDEKALRLREAGFWKGSERVKLHVPMARALSGLAAGLLFAGSPEVRCADEETDRSLQRILKQTGFYGKLLQAAELQSAYGGVLLKLNWNRRLRAHPLLSVVPPDCALPVFEAGELSEARFYSELRNEETTKVCYRLEEVYTPDGRILSGLYRGGEESLGERVALDLIPETEGIEPEVNSGAGVLLAAYVPNRLPNPMAPESGFGRSDYDGLHALLSALDEAYSCLMRDVRLGKARVIVPMEFLRRKELLIDQYSGSAPSWVFDLNEEVFTALDINPQDSGAGITVVQSQIRAAEHLAAIRELAHRILLMAGISPQSFGLGEYGQAESGTALNIRERLSMQTAEVKKTHWWHAIQSLAEAMLRLDAAMNGARLPGELDISVTFADNSQPDLVTIADAIAKLSAAGALSTERKVRMANPDLEDAAVGEEVGRIEGKA